MLRVAASAILLLFLAACASPRLPPAVPDAAPPVQPSARTAPLPEPRIVATAQPLECVTFARALTGIELFGDAGTWWAQAAGRYERGVVPQVGAVLALRPARRSSGHVAVVTGLVGPRVILASHANWLNQGRIHENTPVLDVSPQGDWSAVRVWHIPGRDWGVTVYPAAGFIYPTPLVVADR